MSKVLVDRELKPCPFFGEAARYDWINVGCAAKCYDCGVSVMLGTVGVGWYATEAEAAEDWNRRAQPAEAEGVEVVAFQVRRTARGTTSNLYTEKLPFVPGEGVTQYSEPTALIRLSDHLAALSAVTAERDRVLAEREGKVLVPTEPTEAMLTAYSTNPNHVASAGAIYRAMLSAAMAEKGA